MRTLSVAYLTSRMPAPPLSGGQVREFNLIKRLSCSFDIHLWVVTMFPRICRTGIAEMQKYCRSVHFYMAEPSAGRPADVPLRVWQQRSSEMSSDFIRFLQSSDVDLVHSEGYYMMQYVPDDLDIPVILVEENIEYLIDRQEELIEGKSSAESSWPLTRRRELRQWRRASGCGAVSADDVRSMREAAPDIRPVYIPHGFDHLQLESSQQPAPAQPDGRSVLFVGDYTYPPTHDGAIFLLAEIWPRVVAANSKARLSIVGRGITDEIRSQARRTSDVELVGYVTSVRDALDATDVFVCPLRAGGGVKVKMLEAISRGVPVVTTSVGAQGLPQKIVAEMAVQDNPVTFAGEINRLLADPNARKRHRDALLDAARELPTWDAAAQILGNAWRRFALAGAGARA
jgi:glycosyltransferase involved in cell wall biosynthesis